MRKARIFVNKMMAGILEELSNKRFRFSYEADYQGSPVSLTMPLKNKVYEYEFFPPFFEGLLPEGILLDAILKKYKLDKNDYFGQLLQVGADCIGAVTLEEIK